MRLKRFGYVTLFFVVLVVEYFLVQQAKTAIARKPKVKEQKICVSLTHWVPGCLWSP